MTESTEIQDPQILAAYQQELAKEAQLATDPKEKEKTYVVTAGTRIETRVMRKRRHGGNLITDAIGGKTNTNINGLVGMVLDNRPVIQSGPEFKTLSVGQRISVPPDVIHPVQSSDDIKGEDPKPIQGLLLE